jgi:hypothetical protein
VRQRACFRWNRNKQSAIWPQDTEKLRSATAITARRRIHDLGVTAPLLGGARRLAEPQSSDVVRRMISSNFPAKAEIVSGELSPQSNIFIS